MSTEPQRYTRAVECYTPRGPLSKSAFYRHVREGHVQLKHVGRMAFVAFPSPDALIAHLIEVVPPADRFGRARPEDQAAE